MFAPFTICEVLLEGVISHYNECERTDPTRSSRRARKLTEPSLVSDINTTCKVPTYIYLYVRRDLRIYDGFILQVR